MIKAKQSLGQNFLIDPNTADNIVSAMQLKSNDTVIEIGAGRGILTKRIQPLVRECIALEIDHRFVSYLEHELSDAGNVSIKHQDVLRFDFKSVNAENKLVIMGNIPYNITSPIFFKVLDDRHIVRQLIMLIQREVADRFVSTPHSKNYGILAVLSQTYSKVRILLRVPPTVFKPQPKVESALVRWTFTQEYEKQLIDPKLHRLIVRQAFGQRRKMLRRSLKNLPLSELRLDLTRRPEELSIQEWIDLANKLAEYRNLESKHD